MPDVEALLRRQAEWQRSRRSLSWPEKIRLAEQLRPGIKALRDGRAGRGEAAPVQSRGTGQVAQDR